MLYKNCRLCPNDCSVDRTSSVGVCGVSDKIKIAWAGLHRGEEPPITGENGSGMIFFSGCPLHCQYCQNEQISRRKNPHGYEISLIELENIMLKLEEMGAASLNLVTGTQYIPSIITALKAAKQEGLSLPVVWNSSGYESVDAIKLIAPLIDLYLLDVKTIDKTVAKDFCFRSSYVDVIIPLMDYLYRSRKTDLDSLKGVLVRHLVFPGTVDSSMKFLYWFSKNFKDRFSLSLMFQFVDPNGKLLEKVKEDEYEKLLAILSDEEIDGFVQEIKDEDEWIPDFTLDIPFPHPFSDVLPYFLTLKNRSSQIFPSR